MKFEELKEFKKDVKKISKKHISISEDIEVVKKVLTVSPSERPPFSFRIDGLGVESCIIKVKKIASKSFKGKGVNSGFRIIYAHFEKEDRIVLIEVYHKSDKEIEDKKRILDNFK
jgi:mRNA-degrading endonuclease RelE of RelBE toxin-antitoxin system